MLRLTDINTLKSLMKQFGLSFIHGLGQNFIVDSAVVDRIIVMSGVDADSAVLEIGAGVGTLSCRLCECSSCVVTVEIDKKLVPLLGCSLKDYKNVHILNRDFLKIDLEKLWFDYFNNFNVYICANLPYYVSSAIIMKILESGVNFKSLTVMVQKEMAQRICASVGSRKTGTLGVFVNYYCIPEFLFTVGRGSFFPVPKVDSAVIKLVRRENSAVKVFDESLFFKIVKQSFLKRRKKLSNSLVPFQGVSKEDVLKVLKSLDVSDLRPENLSLEQFASVANLFRERIIEYNQDKNSGSL